MDGPGKLIRSLVGVLVIACRLETASHMSLNDADCSSCMLLRAGDKDESGLAEL